MKSFFIFIAAFALLAAANEAFAQGTAFTYQGRLHANGAPANGTYDLQFTVHDSSGGPNAIAGPVTNSAVVVANGLFTALLDFGTGVFTGPARWLQIDVRPNGVGAFVPLNPRQAVNPSPYSLHASTASDVVSSAVVKSVNTLKDNVTLAAGANVTITPSGNTLTIASTGGGGGETNSLWSRNGANAYYNAGNVGIGTTSPAERMTIAGVPAYNTGLKLTGSTTAGTGLALENTSAGGHKYAFLSGGSGTSVGAGGFGIYDDTAGDYRFAISGTGNVGLGTAVPARKLTVFSAQYGFEHTDGTVRLGTYLNGTGGWLGTINNYPLKFFVNDGGPSMTIETNGNVGIGTPLPPFSKLEVQASPGNPDTFKVRNSSGGWFFALFAGDPNSLTMYGDAYKSSGGTSWYTVSDRRLKQNVREYEPGLKEILKLRAVRFRYRDDAQRGLTSKHEEIGFVAQEVREAIPDAVMEDKDGYLSLKADAIHWAGINAIRELNQKLEGELKRRNAENAELKQRLAELERGLHALADAVNGEVR